MKTAPALFLAFFLVLFLPAPPALPGLAAQSSRGRLFPPLSLGVLEGPDRVQWNKPDLIMDALNIADGSIVADLGAGGGWFTVPARAASRAEGPRVRRRHPAVDDRSHQAPRAA